MVLSTICPTGQASRGPSGPSEREVGALGHVVHGERLAGAADPSRVVRAHPALRQAHAEARLRARHPRGRFVVRAVGRRRDRVDQPRQRRRERGRRARARHGLPRHGPQRRPFLTGRGPRGPRGRAHHPQHHLAAERRRQARRRHPDRRPRGDDDVRRHLDLAARAHLLDRVHAGRPALHALLRRH